MAAYEVKYIYTTANKLNDLPISNGQIIVLSDKVGYFYDMNGTRTRVDRIIQLNSLPSSADGEPDMIYVVSGSPYMWTQNYGFKKLNQDDYTYVCNGDGQDGPRLTSLLKSISNSNEGSINVIAENTSPFALKIDVYEVSSNDTLNVPVRLNFKGSGESLSSVELVGFDDISIQNLTSSDLSFNKCRKIKIRSCNFCMEDSSGCVHIKNTQTTLPSGLCYVDIQNCEFRQNIYDRIIDEDCVEVAEPININSLNYSPEFIQISGCKFIECGCSYNILGSNNIICEKYPSSQDSASVEIGVQKFFSICRTQVYPHVLSAGKYVGDVGSLPSHSVQAYVGNWDSASRCVRLLLYSSEFNGSPSQDNCNYSEFNLPEFNTLIDSSVRSNCAYCSVPYRRFHDSQELSTLTTKFWLASMPDIFSELEIRGVIGGAQYNYLPACLDECEDMMSSNVRACKNIIDLNNLSVVATRSTVADPTLTNRYLSFTSSLTPSSITLQPNTPRNFLVCCKVTC